MSRYPEKKKQNKTKRLQFNTLVTGYLSWGWGGFGREKKKEEKRSQREVEKKVIWRLLMGGDKHNEKSKIQFKKTGRK
jgi:hypothetical protein